MQTTMRRPDQSDYFNFFDEHLAGARRCAVTGNLMVLKQGEWKSVKKLVPELRAKASISHLLKKCEIPLFLNRYLESKPFQFLVDIPRWDSKDRIKTIANCLELNSGTQREAEKIIKEWGSKIFERIRNPHVQNVALILKGKGDNGRERLIRSMISGFGPYFGTMNVKRDPVSNFIISVDHLAIEVRNCDSLNYVTTGRLMHMITQYSVSFRRPWEKYHKQYIPKSSFIGCLDTDDMQPEFKTNRRFIILDIKNVKPDYPMTESLQILAQFQCLSLDPYRRLEDEE